MTFAEVDCRVCKAYFHRQYRCRGPMTIFHKARRFSIGPFLLFRCWLIRPQPDTTSQNEENDRPALPARPLRLCLIRLPKCRLLMQSICYCIVLLSAARRIYPVVWEPSKIHLTIDAPWLATRRRLEPKGSTPGTSTR